MKQERNQLYLQQLSVYATHAKSEPWEINILQLPSTNLSFL